MKALFCFVILASIVVISTKPSKRDGCRATAVLLCNNGEMNGGIYPGGMNSGMNGGMYSGGMNPGMNGGMYPGGINSGMNGGMYSGGMNPGMNGGVYPGGITTGGGQEFLACCMAMCGDDCYD